MQNNPYRYRGYYFDKDLNLYYLNARYYDQVTGRFINADDLGVVAATPAGLTDKNIFAYCDNNPVARVDKDGELWITLGIMAIGGLIGAAVSATLSIVSQQATSGEIDWAVVGISAGAGFLSGALSASPLGVWWQIAGGAAISMAEEYVISKVTDADVTVADMIDSGLQGGLGGLLGGPGSNYKFELTNMIKNTNKTIVREARRANQKHAAKVVARAKQRRNAEMFDEFVVGGAKNFFDSAVLTFIEIALGG